MQSNGVGGHEVPFLIGGVPVGFADTGKGHGKSACSGDNAVRPCQVLVGDTLHDLDVAQALGVDCVLVARGYHSDARLRQSSTHVLACLDELHAALGLEYHKNEKSNFDEAPRKYEVG
jgi:HAD-hyrolase-like